VNNPEERRRVRVAAHQFVAEQRREGEHAAQRVEFYVSLMPGAASPKRERQIQNVVGEICSWEGAEVSGRHTVLSHTEFERKLYAGLSLSAQPARTEEAARLLREAALLDPSHALPDFLLGLLQQSEDDLATAVRKNPRSLRALVELGVMEARSGKSHKALERFLAAAELAPGYEGPFVQAAAAMADAGATKEAEEFAKLAESLVQPVRNARRQPAPGRPAWQMLDEDLHLQTLSPDYAPEGLLQMIPGEPRRVLDVGCFCGGTGRWLKRRYPKCRVSGVEMLEKAAAMAAEVYDRVLVGKLEDFDLPSEGIEAGSLDAIIAADVLEHVFNPWQALLRLRPLLAPGGALYVSLPNVRNLRVLSELAQGKFHYEGSGILDVTHVRFFTRASAIEMLEQTGFAVTDMRINPDQAVAPQFEGQDLSEIHTVEVDGLRLSGLGSDDVLELAALQFYIRATPAQAA
jgi:2-polyprenyl-3-methyl-5-hydroxy-6-metoxy-1,4-benzoquinol methylase